MQPVVLEQNLFVLRQARDLLSRVDDETYRTPDPVARASLGAHLRHCLDAYRCFLSGAEGGSVDYDRRDRDPRIEHDVAFADAVVRAIEEALPPFGAELDRELLVRSDCETQEEGQEEGWTSSTVGRELRYLFSHTVHHFAILALVLRHRGIEPGEEFGVAPSTLAFRRAVSESG
jgi:uncharacterized damage-inducible protein DinB